MTTKKGFSLIELIIVISITLVLTTIAIVSYAGTNAKARDGRRMSDLEKIRLALEMYRQKNARYPGQSSTVPDGLVPDYMQSWPADPKGGSWGAYVYLQNGSYLYSLYARMEDLGSTNTTTTITCGTLACNYVVTNP